MQLYISCKIEDDILSLLTKETGNIFTNWLLCKFLSSCVIFSHINIFVDSSELDIVGVLDFILYVI